MTSRRGVSGERHSMQVKIAGEKLHYVAQKLSRVRYAFKVRAQTAVGWGPARIQNMSTAPQLGTTANSRLHSVTRLCLEMLRKLHTDNQIKIVVQCEKSPGQGLTH